MEIRRAVADDASAIALLLYKSFVEYESSYTTEAFAATVSTPEQISVRIDEGPIWIALQDGKLVGTVSAVAKGEALYIRGMAVDPQARGSGTGSALLNRVEEFAIQRGFKSLFLSTTPFLSHAIRLYERCGFHRSPDEPHDLLGTPLFTMKKTLKD
jgi:N-acetylglutamate synthase-like GNAT family acetyltransferase